MNLTQLYAQLVVVLTKLRDTLMGMEETSVEPTANDSIVELWLFGSRARGDSRPDSDVDLALALIPPNGK
jgi:predicted nucleotidyltransferase